MHLVMRLSDTVIVLDHGTVDRRRARRSRCSAIRCVLDAYLGVE